MSTADERKKSGEVEQVDFTNYVFLPLSLTKKFDVGRLWVGDNSFIIRHPNGNFVCVWAMDASIMGVMHGDNSPLRNDIVSQRSKVMDTSKCSVASTVGGLNRLYHMQLKNFLSRPLPPVTIDDEEDESGGCVPQLRADMVLMVELGHSVGSDLIEGRAQLIAHDRKDMHSWMRNNVVAVAREDLEQLTGPLPKHFDKSSAEFASWLDLHFG